MPISVARSRSEVNAAAVNATMGNCSNDQRLRSNRVAS
jgi:hypothetical protein